MFRLVIAYLFFSISSLNFAFTIVDNTGKTWHKQDLVGKVVVVNFWATWCPPCLVEIPLLVELADDYAKQVQVLGINHWDEVDDKALAEFIDLYGINYPIIIGEDTPQIVQQFGNLRGLPTTFVYDKNGKLQQKVEGEIDENLISQWLTKFNLKTTD